MVTFGASFSLHRCSEFGLNKKAVLTAAINDLGIKRYRLMSYWNIHEQKRGKYDFRELDWQLDLIAKHGGKVTLCLGKRQPRWPECHMPGWALQLSKEEWYEALFTFIETVVKRYRNHPALVSWQLENEALLKSFGNCKDGDYSHKRLRKELEIVKSLDSRHPVVMSLSDSWGLPIRKPKPDQYAMSLYRITINKNGEYVCSKRPALFYKTRKGLIRAIKFRSTFIHELQAEPWLPRAIMDTTVEDQLEYMNPELIAEIIQYAIQTGSKTIDLWGLEWWYWLKQQGKPEVWEAVRSKVAQRG